MRGRDAARKLTLKVDILQVYTIDFSEIQLIVNRNSQSDGRNKSTKASMQASLRIAWSRKGHTNTKNDRSNADIAPRRRSLERAQDAQCVKLCRDRDSETDSHMKEGRKGGEMVTRDEVQARRPTRMITLLSLVTCGVVSPPGLSPVFIPQPSCFLSTRKSRHLARVKWKFRISTKGKTKSLRSSPKALSPTCFYIRCLRKVFETCQRSVLGEGWRWKGGGWAREEERANADHPGNAENDKGPSDSAHDRVVDALVTMQRQVRTAATARAASTHVRSSFFRQHNAPYYQTRVAQSLSEKKKVGGWVLAHVGIFRDCGMSHMALCLSVMYMKARVLPCTRPQHLEQHGCGAAMSSWSDDNGDASSGTKKRRKRTRTRRHCRQVR